MRGTHLKRRYSVVPFARISFLKAQGWCLVEKARFPEGFERICVPKFGPERAV